MINETKNTMNYTMISFATISATLATIGFSFFACSEPIPHCNDFMSSKNCQKCENGFYETPDGKCAQINEYHCGKYGEINCFNSNSHWQKATCNNNKCQLIQCENGFYNDGENHCLQQDVNHCGVDGTLDCIAMNGIMDAICQNNQCIAKACSKGYHLSNNYCAQNTANSCPENKQIVNCLSKHRSDGWSQAKCGNSGCEATGCAVGYYLFNSICKQNDDYNCGKYGKSCYQAGVSSAKCIINSNNKPQCIALKCSQGYYFDESSETCKKQDEHHCGANNFDCAKLNGWGSGECRKGQCILKRCKSGFTVNNDFFGNGCTCERPGIRDYFGSDKENNNCVYEMN